MILMRKQGRQVSADDMRPEIRRNIANSQPPLWVSLISVCSRTLFRRLAEPLIPTALFASNCGCVPIREEMHCADKIAVGRRIFRLQMNGFTVRSNSLLEVPSILECVTQIVVNDRTARLIFERASIFSNGLIEPPALQISYAEIIVSIGVSRPVGERLPIRAHGFIHPASVS